MRPTNNPGQNETPSYRPRCALSEHQKRLVSTPRETPDAFTGRPASQPLCA